MKKYETILHVTHTVRLLREEKYSEAEHKINIVYPKGNSCIKFVRTNLGKGFLTPISLAIQKMVFLLNMPAVSTLFCYTLQRK